MRFSLSLTLERAQESLRKSISVTRSMLGHAIVQPAVRVAAPRASNSA